MKEVKISSAKFRDLLPESMKAQPLTESESSAILKEAMALYREKYERQNDPEPQIDKVSGVETEDDEDELVM